MGAAGRRRNPFPLPRSATAAPWGSSTEPCIIHDTYGSGATVHPSVVDMGEKWNGFRWWMANTPYPNSSDAYENPCLYASNDRLNWHVPAGVVNPLDPYPGSGSFYSDTEIAWDPDQSRLVIYYRLYVQATGVVTLIALTSSDGSNWTRHVIQETVASVIRSPSVVRVGTGDWVMYGRPAGPRLVANNALGPWTQSGVVTAETTLTAWHGDTIQHGDRWLSAYSTTDASGRMEVRSSWDGLHWSAANFVMGTGEGWMQTKGVYRPTIVPSTEPGFIDCWYSGQNTSLPGHWRIDYVRLPVSLWPEPPA